MHDVLGKLLVERTSLFAPIFLSFLSLGSLLSEMFPQTSLIVILLLFLLPVLLSESYHFPLENFLSIQLVVLLLLLLQVLPGRYLFPSRTGSLFLCYRIPLWTISLFFQCSFLIVPVVVWFSLSCFQLLLNVKVFSSQLKVVLDSSWLLNDSDFSTPWTRSVVIASCPVRALSSDPNSYVLNYVKKGSVNWEKQVFICVHMFNLL